IVWACHSFEKLRTIALYESIEAIQLVPCAKMDFGRPLGTESFLVTAGESGLLKVWDHRTGSLLHTQANSLLKVQSRAEEQETEEAATTLDSQYTLISQLLYHDRLEQ